MLRESGEVGEPAIFKTSNPDNSLNAGINSTLVPERSCFSGVCLHQEIRAMPYLHGTDGRDLIATGRMVDRDPGCGTFILLCVVLIFCSLTGMRSGDWSGSM